MKYLVTGEFIEPGPSASPELMAQILKTAVLPSLDTLATWERENRISGGLLVGERAGVFVVKARSNREVDQMLEKLPFWTFLKWKVSPLNSFSNRVSQDLSTVERLDRLMGGKK
jgi:muconolactone delta-isomerase